MKLTNLHHVPEQPLTKGGSHRTKVRYLVEEKDGARRFYLRSYTVEKGGFTPLDDHPYEHQVYVLEGRGLVRVGKQEFVIKPGDVVYVSTHEQHQFLNFEDEPLVFLCVKGAERLYEKPLTELIDAS